MIRHAVRCWCRPCSRHRRPHHRRTRQCAIRLRLEAVQRPVGIEVKPSSGAFAARRPHADATANDFEDLTGGRLGFEQIPEQQQRPKVAMAADNWPSLASTSSMSADASQ